MSSIFTEEISETEINELIAFAQADSLRSYDGAKLQEEPVAKDSTSNILSTQIGGKAGEFLYEGAEAKGFHLSAGSTYIYPTNYPVRQYQAAIVRAALFKNTLVSLPTGLGKTFIAAVVMYNFYRWYPSGKVVFLAPTRPLVAQQTKACHHIMNIPQDDTTEMTGVQSAETRASLWLSKRVFFLTPQVMVNDLKTGSCPAALIKCVVIDEAHKATKDYAYCQVLKILSETEAVFRVLGLSATPGNDVSAVQQVLKNLHIAALELRSEESLDVAPYIHSRDINKIVVELTGNILRVKEDLLQIFEKYARKLKDYKALSYNISSISKFQVLKACEKFRANPPRGVPPAVIGSLISDFTVCMSLAHSLELLQIYGLRAFYTYLADENGDKSKTVSSRLKNDEHLREMLKRLHGCLYPKPTDNCPYTWGHPKLQKLVAALNDHFKKEQEKSVSTKAIVFCQYRVVVSEIVELLNKCRPLIKPAEFIGQSGGKEKGMPQAKQLQIMKDFRAGLINCLVATCVAEEGLDIGEVDLIVLMEAHKSPVRLVQRLGRTGRKRRGHCIVLLTKGREEQKFLDAMATRKSYIQNIVNAPSVKASLAADSPRMIPPGCSPVQQLVHIHASNFKSPARPASKKQTDIRKCFNGQEVVPHTSDEELLLALEELGGSEKLVFDTIPRRQELWPRRQDPKISFDELFSKDVSRLSEWNDWNHEEQPTFFVGHTAESILLPYLLSASTQDLYLKEFTSSKDGDPVSSEVNIRDKDSPPPKDRKRKKKEISKKNIGMDIRNCLALAGEKIKEIDNEVIEIISDESNDVFPEPLPSLPPLKKPKSSLSKVDLTSHDISISSFEENNNLNNLLDRYAFPKTSLKKSFNFQKKLPVIEGLLNCVTVDILMGLDVKKLVGADVCIIYGAETVVSPFGVDDLFTEDNSRSREKLPSPTETQELPSSDNQGKLVELEMNKSSLSMSFDLDSILDRPIDHEIKLDTPRKNVEKQVSSQNPITKEIKTLTSCFNLNSAEKVLTFSPKNIAKDSQNSVPPSISLDLDSIFSEPMSLNISQNEKKVEFSEKRTPSSALKTLTSSFVDLQRSNKKILENFREKKKKLSQHPISKFFSTDKAQVNSEEMPSSKQQNVHTETKSYLKPIPEEEFEQVFPHDENFDEDIFNNARVLNASSTPVKSADSLIPSSKSTNISSPIYNKDFVPPGNLTSSTPLISVKKFKKNVVLSEISSKNSISQNILHQNENFVAGDSSNAPETKTVHSPVDVWNLSDVLEENDENVAHTKAQESTMFGITQMVSLIEKEKHKSDISSHNSHMEPGKSSTNSENLSVFLESDVDIFRDFDVQPTDVDDSYKVDSMLTQKYNRVKDGSVIEISDEVSTVQNKSVNMLSINLGNKVKRDSVIEISDECSTVQNKSVNMLSINLGNKVKRDSVIEISDECSTVQNKSVNMLSNILGNKVKRDSVIEISDDSYSVNNVQVINRSELDGLLTQKYNDKVESVFEISVNNVSVDGEYIVSSKIEFPDSNRKPNSVENKPMSLSIGKNSKTDELPGSCHDPNQNDFEIIPTDDFVFDNLMLSQKYNIVTEEKSIEPHVSQVKNDYIKLNKKHSEPLENCSSFRSNGALTESIPPASQSQVPNFKKFSKKNILGLKSLKEASECIKKNSLQSSESVSVDNKIENPSTKTETEPPRKNISFSEQVMKNNPEEEFSELLNFNFSEPKAKLSLFQSKKNQKKVNLLSDESDDEIFILPSSSSCLNPPAKKNTSISTSDDSFKKVSEVKENMKVKKKIAKKKKERCCLIENEADVSGTVSSDDSDGSSLDDLDNSFINDETECFTQAMYLKSVKSPVNRGKFKIPAHVDCNADVFSQAVVQDSSYVNDSFCVGSDEEENSDEYSMSILEIAERKLHQRNKKKSDTPIKRKKSRRIVKMKSSEEDSESPQSSPHRLLWRSPGQTCSQPVVRTSVPIKRRRLLSDSESDSSPLRKKKGLKSNSPFSPHHSSS